MAKGKGGPTLPVLSKTERENLDKQVREEQSYLKGNPAGAPVKSEAELPAGEVLELNAGASERRIARTQAAISRLSPEAQRLTGAKRADAEKEYKQLGDWLKERMLTVAEVNAFPSKGTEPDADMKQAIYEQAVKKIGSSDGEMSPAFISRAQRWQNLGRILWPDDESRSKMESIRPQGSKSGRHFGA